MYTRMNRFEESHLFRKLRKNNRKLVGTIVIILLSVNTCQFLIFEEKKIKVQSNIGFSFVKKNKTNKLQYIPSSLLLCFIYLTTDCIFFRLHVVTSFSQNERGVLKSDDRYKTMSDIQSSQLNMNVVETNDNNGSAAAATVTAMPTTTTSSTTTTTVPITSNNNNNNNTNNGFYLRWCRIEKSVVLKHNKESSSISTTSHNFLDRSMLNKSKTGGQPGQTHTTSVGLNNVKVEQVHPITISDTTTTTATTTTTPLATKKVILKGISGYAAPGEILALMGPSGSGKTSLLNVLSGRSSYQNGMLSINGSVTNNSKLKRLKRQIAYVKQSDIFFEHLTVRDQFTYTALLRLDRSLSTIEKMNQVNRIIKDLRLTKVAENQIRTCSGGEKKRINIGSEILTSPLAILLDEPTSGLDSSSAVSLMKLLASFAKEHGKTVITSIHQPSSAVFHSFDKLLMLSEGTVVYFGTPQNSLAYLRTQQLTCPDGYNLADHWMDVLVNERSVDYDDNANTTTADAATNGDLDPEEAKAALMLSPRQQLEQAWDDNAVAEDIEMNIQTQLDTTQHSGTVENMESSKQKHTSKYQTSWTNQYLILTHRALKNSQSAIFTPLNLIKSVALGLIAGLLWFQREYTERNVNDIRSYYFFTMTFWVFDAMFGALTTFPSERVVILKERSSGSYHLSAYFLAKISADVPVRLTLPFLYMIISFWMAGISTSFVTFLGSTGCTLLSVLAGESIGLLFGAAVYDLQKAITMMTVFTLFLMLLGGFFVENVPDFLAWAKYVSPFKYAFDSSLQLVFDHPVPCDGSGALEELCQDNNESASAEDVLDFVGIQGSIAFNVGMLLVVCSVPRYLAYWALRRKKEGER